MDSIQIIKSEVEPPAEDNKQYNKKVKSKDEKMLMKRVGKLYEGVRDRCSAFFEEAEVYEKLEQMVVYFQTSPLLVCGIFAVLVAIATPIVLFVLFAVVNVAFIVAGFIILEVSIFIMGATVLSCSVFFVITTAAVIGLCLLSFYLIICYLIILLKKFKV